MAVRQLPLAAWVFMVGGWLLLQDPAVGAEVPEADRASLAAVDNFRLAAFNQEEAGGSEHDEYGYLEVSSFFNIREANANVEQGEWEFEVPSGWSTGGGGDDDFDVAASLKYGITNDLFVELGVLPINIGDGGDQGNGDIFVELFQQLLHENGSWLPAAALWAEMRLPTGDGSSKVDGEFHLNLTKTIVPDFRAHVEGFVETANGGRGNESEDREHFQWGAGPGFDYQIDEKTIALLNYLYHSREEEGGKGSNVIEIGVARELVEGQHLKLAADIGVDGRDSTPNFGAKVQWSIEWK